jgi:Holliday junction resolvase RusA-like endonuclease
MKSMKTVYDFFISGAPKAQPRPRMTKTGHVYTPDSAKLWKEIVSSEFIMRRQPLITNPVRLTVNFFFPVPKKMKNVSDYLPHVAKPDADNLVKAVMDAMTDTGVWSDDSLVYSSIVEKWYYRGRSGARIKVEIAEEV